MAHVLQSDAALPGRANTLYASSVMCITGKVLKGASPQLAFFPIQVIGISNSLPDTVVTATNEDAIINMPLLCVCILYMHDIFRKHKRLQES